MPESAKPPLTAEEIRYAFSDYILVIGSAHLDVMGDYTHDQEKNIDKLGMVHYAIGGTAFNVAANLAASRKPVSLYTHLRKGSLVTEAILSRCRQDGINPAFICVDEGLMESGFVAHRRQGEVVSAVSQMGICTASLDAEVLRDALRGCAFAVMDCNLIEPQIAFVSQLAHEARAPLIRKQPAGQPDF